MEYLLDTHALIWWFESSPQLSRRASSLLASPSNDILISAAIGWELAIKVNIGKFHTPTLVHDLDEIIAGAGFTELPISLEHAVRAGLLPFHHRDPFDRLLVAQAQSLNIAIVSADAVLDRYGIRRIW